jgi:hypothetical protein
MRGLKETFILTQYLWICILRFCSVEQGNVSLYFVSLPYVLILRFFCVAQHHSEGAVYVTSTFSRIRSNYTCLMCVKDYDAVRFNRVRILRCFVICKTFGKILRVTPVGSRRSIVHTVYIPEVLTDIYFFRVTIIFHSGIPFLQRILENLQLYSPYIIFIIVSLRLVFTFRVSPPRISVIVFFHQN